MHVGRLRRDVHTSIYTPSSDERIVAVIRDKIPDCRQRLNYVVEQTENAAHSPLDAVEHMMVVTRAISADARIILAADGKQ